VWRRAGAGTGILGVAAPVEYRELPARARTTCDGIAPGGELQFCGWERGERGLGYRVEKSYDEPVEHVRSLLVDGDGNVMERSHTVPVAKVPEHVLSAALAGGSFVDRAEIVSGPVREEYWHLVVRNRHGEVFLCRIGLDGGSLEVRRRQHTRIDS